MFSNRRKFLTFAGSGVAALAIGCTPAKSEANEKFEVSLTRDQWKKRLTPAQFSVLREGGTERPFSHPLDKEKRAGTFACAGCALPLFSSRTKFDSGTGWPSFYAPMKNAVVERADNSLLMARVEILCRRCGGHLGHVFDDGPKPTGKRYCMNGTAMTFKAA